MSCSLLFREESSIKRKVFANNFFLHFRRWIKFRPVWFLYFRGSFGLGQNYRFSLTQVKTNNKGEGKGNSVFMISYLFFCNFQAKYSIVPMYNRFHHSLSFPFQSVLPYERKSGVVPNHPARYFA